jgi:hypothetical protein
LTNDGICGVLGCMMSTQKITAHVPAQLLRAAQAATGEGITATVRRGLVLVAAAKASDDLRQLRGKLRLDLDLAQLRRDRSSRPFAKPSRRKRD